jgi:hypothetical protein
MIGVRLFWLLTLTSLAIPSITPLQVVLALLLLHQAVQAQEDNMRNGQSPNIVKATIEVTQT